MDKKKVLISGATGFIGRNTAEHLAKRDDLEIYGTYFNSKPYDNQKINWRKANLTREEEVNGVVEGMDVIIHMAATTSGVQDIVSKPYIHVTNNAVMGHLILRSAFENNVKHFIFPSCTVMYPPINEKPVKETDCTGQIEMKYLGGATTKLNLEKICEFFSGFGRTKHTVFRHSNVYGPHDTYNTKESHVFGATITKVMNAEEGGIVNVWGEGTEERDLIYVDDLVSFIETAIDKQNTPFELVNVGLGKSISIKELTKKVIDISGKNLNIKHDLMGPSIKTKVALDCAKAKQIYGWEPKVSLEEGIKKTLDWYKANIK